MKFYSTNLKAPEVSFKEALMKGQAPDKGLYMPKNIPKLSDDELKSMSKKDYSDIAFMIIKKFVDNIPDDTLIKLCNDAYNFDVPLEHITKRNYLMRLDQGPTASFKDFAARMMARLMNYFCKKENKKLTILTATSGDTGSAVANAFYGSENVNMVVLFPKDEVSDRQRKQMTTLKGNITSVSLEGKFDDCQALVKKAFSDPDLSRLNLSSANSINIGRLVPQSVYYVYAYSRLAKNNEKIIFSVPSGNFGDMMGCVLAREMGLPVEKIIVGVNENDEFPKFLETGKYEPIKPSKKCLSNAMNVGHPSNLARLIALYGGQMDETGKINKMPNLEKMKKDLFAISVTDNETKNTIKETYKKYKVILEPHGAVGYNALLKSKIGGLIVSLETAHPAKFPEIIREEIGIDLKLPKSMEGLEKKKEKFSKLGNDYEEFKEFLLSLSL